VSYLMLYLLLVGLAWMSCPLWRRPVMRGLKGCQSQERTEIPKASDTPVGPRPGFSPDRDSDQRAKPPEVVTVVQQPNDRLDPSIITSGVREGDDE